MKIECVKDVLERAVIKADKITGRNLSLPVLNSILISIENKKVYIKATNLDLGIEIIVPAKIEGEGSVALPGAILRSYLSQIKSRTVILDFKNGIITITSDKGKTTLKTVNHEDFPIIPKLPNTSSFQINSNEFIDGLKSVWYTASPSSIKPELSSVYIYHSFGKLVFVATDSFRLAEKKISFTHKDEFPSILIPFKNIPEIIRSLEGLEKINILFTKNQIAFITESLYLTSRIVEGTFPDYKNIIPKEFTTEATLLKEDLIETLQVMHIFADKFNQVQLSLKPKEKYFEITSKNADLGEGSQRVDAALSGQNLDIAFNHRYISDVFQSISSDSVSLSFGGTQKPLLIRGVSDQSFVYIVMPMNR